VFSPRILLAIGLFGLGGCASPSAPPLEPIPDFVDSYLSAFNQHDVDSMRAFWTDDIEWVDVSGDELIIISDSADELAAMMTSYFSDHPDVRSETEAVLESGQLLAFVETARWTQDGQGRTQEALAVYHLENGKISRFWYLASK